MPSGEECCAVEEPDWKGSLGEAFEHALAYLEGLPTRPVTGHASLAELRRALGGPLPERRKRGPVAVAAGDRVDGGEQCEATRENAQDGAGEHGEHLRGRQCRT